MSKNDTIAAVSTAPGEAGIAVIRVSGPESVSVAGKIFRCKTSIPTRGNALFYGRVVDNGRALDEAILLVMRAPRSYTREDVVEFQCHGGSISARRILRAILRHNVRPAEPGEFTRRAFLNGRIDLLQAEAVLDMIRAQTDKSADLAVEQLNGVLTRSIENIYNNMLQLCADLEASLDFTEEDFLPPLYASIKKRLGKIQNQIKALLGTYDEGHLIKDGALVVITGRPNVGKSSLLNAILGKARVIVSPIPGTTRDIIEEHMVINGIPIRLVDTAGLRYSKCEIEKEGVRRARDAISGADLILYVIDGSKRLTNQERDSILRIPHGKIIVVKNKTDLGNCALPASLKSHRFENTQLIYNKGLTRLKKAIASKLNSNKRHISNIVISERHRHILMTAEGMVSEATALMKQRDESLLAIVAQKIREANEQLAILTGKNFYHEMLDSIFTRFCVGK